MSVATASHGVDESLAVFVTDGVLAIEVEVILGRDGMRNGDHGGTLWNVVGVQNVWSLLEIVTFWLGWELF